MTFELFNIILGVLTVAIAIIIIYLAVSDDKPKSI